MAIGAEGYFMAYDVKENKLLYGGIAAQRHQWNERSTLWTSAPGFSIPATRAHRTTS